MLCIMLCLQVTSLTTQYNLLQTQSICSQTQTPWMVFVHTLLLFSSGYINPRMKLYYSSSRFHELYTLLDNNVGVKGKEEKGRVIKELNPFKFLPSKSFTFKITIQTKKKIPLSSSPLNLPLRDMKRFVHSLEHIFFLHLSTSLSFGLFFILCT